MTVGLLINWFWHSAVIVVATECLLRAGRRWRVDSTCAPWWTALGLVLASPALTWARPALDGPASVSLLPALPAVLPAPPDWLFLCFGAAWAIWATVALSRLLTAVSWVRRARRASVPFPAEREARLPQWCQRKNQGRAARLVVSQDVRAAALLGLGRPLIAVTVEALDALTDRELDQIVIHEWVHLQRRDDIGRWAEAAAHVVAGFHPAVWWIGRRLRAAREFACDAHVVRVTGNPRSYAASLVRLTELTTLQEQPPLVPAVLAAPVTLRVRRLLEPSPQTTWGHQRLAIALTIAPLLCLGNGILGVSLVVFAPVEGRIASRPLVLQKQAFTGRVMFSPFTPEPLIDSSGPSRWQPAGPGGISGQSDAAVSVVGSAASEPPVPDPLSEQATDVPVADPTPVSSASLAAHMIVSPVLPASGPGLERAPETAWSGFVNARAATAAGDAVARSSRKAALATAGAFTRAGRTITTFLE